MTPFEFVFALISIITSLALTRIITGVVAMIRHGERGGFSLLHALWLWIAFAVLMGNWGALWGYRELSEWPAIRVLAWLTSMTSLYAFCELVVPEVESGKPLNLRAFHEGERRRYILAHNFFAGLAFTLVIAISGLTSASMRMFVPPLVALALGMAALLARGRAELIATVLVAAVATTFMLMNMNILPAEGAR